MASLEIDLYRTDDYVRAGRIGLMPLLHSVFEPLLGRELDGAVYRLTFHPVEDREVLEGEPSVINLRGSHGYVHVRIAHDGVVLYQHPHSLRELVARPLQALLREQIPGERHWGYGIVGPGLEGLALVRPKPRALGTMDVAAVPKRPQVFRLEEMPEPDLPLITLEELGVKGAPATDAALGIVLSADVHDAFLRGMRFSEEVEEGGFLIGHVHRNAERPGGHLVSVEGVLQAERTGASMLHFTFTGESFLRMNDVLAQRQRDERLVGWYHTHLFAPSKAIGLSSIDVELHARTFRRPWQVAGLLNIVDSGRTLRFYGMDGKRVLQAPYWARSS
jgi:hypothetical protein